MLKIRILCHPTTIVTKSTANEAQNSQLGRVERGICNSPKKNYGGCSPYLLGGKICELVPLSVVKPKMTPARVVAVHFKGLLGHQSDKITKAVTIFVAQITITSQLFAWKWSYHWQLICYFRIGTSKGCKWNQSHAHKMRFWYLLSAFSRKFPTSTPVIPLPWFSPSHQTQCIFGGTLLPLLAMQFAWLALKIWSSLLSGPLRTSY